MTTLAILQYLRDFFAALAPLTPIKSDDALVVCIDATIHDAHLLGFVQRVDDDATEGITVAVPRAFSPDVEHALRARGIVPAQFMEYLPLIIQLIQLFRKNRA